MMFNLGLLHEVGHAAMFLKAPEASLQALDQSFRESRDLAAVEQESLGFDYAEAGAELMRIWHLPGIYAQVAAFHRQPELADIEYRFAAEVVCLAHELCQDRDSQQHRMLILQAMEQVPDFQALPDDIDQIVRDEIAKYTDSVISLLWPGGAQNLPQKRGFFASDWDTEDRQHA